MKKKAWANLKKAWANLKKTWANLNQNLPTFKPEFARVFQKRKIGFLTT